MSMHIDIHGQTPLHITANFNDINLALILIDKMPIEDIALANTENGYTALHIAAQHGAFQIVQLLLSKCGNALANLQDKFGQTALHWAVVNNDLLSSVAIIEKMNSVDLQLQSFENGYTALHLAAQNKNSNIVNSLLNKGGFELAKTLDNYGQTALHWAATRSCFMSCSLLCDCLDIENIFRKNDEDKTALDCVRSEDVVISQLLLRKTACKN